MLIGEYTAQAGTTRRFGVVGSCRVHDPSIALLKSERIRRVWTGFNAFTHGIPDSEQYLNFLRGLVDISDAMAPFVFREEHAPTRDPKLTALIGELDDVIVEISSPIHLHLHGVALQQDYFWRMFIRQYGATLSEWYVSLMDAKPNHPANIEKALAALAAAGHEVTPFVEDVVRGTRCERLSPQGVRQGLESIMFDARKRWIIATHVVVPGVSTAMMAERARFNGVLREQAESLGAEVFDPTPLVETAGREKAMAADGADLYHYRSRLQSGSRQHAVGGAGVRRGAAKACQLTRERGRLPRGSAGAARRFCIPILTWTGASPISRPAASTCRK